MNIDPQALLAYGIMIPKNQTNKENQPKIDVGPEAMLAYGIATGGQNIDLDKPIEFKTENMPSVCLAYGIATIGLENEDSNKIKLPDNVELSDEKMDKLKELLDQIKELLGIKKDDEE